MRHCSVYCVCTVYESMYLATRPASRITLDHEQVSTVLIVTRDGCLFWRPVAGLLEKLNGIGGSSARTMGVPFIFLCAPILAAFRFLFSHPWWERI